MAALLRIAIIQEHRKPTVKSRSYDLLAFQALFLSLHVFNDNIIDVTDRLAIFQDFPWFICMKVNLDQGIISHNKQAITLEMLGDVIIDDILVKILPINQKLGVEFEFKLFHVLFSFYKSDYSTKTMFRQLTRYFRGFSDREGIYIAGGIYMANSTDYSLCNISKQLEEGVLQVFQSESYRKYLKTLSCFRKYSLNNSLLIFMQKPDATLVASYTSWKKLNRYVNKGEKAIRILAPRKQAKKETKEEDEEDIVYGFRSVPVFDVSQTNGQELSLSLAIPLEGVVDNYDLFLRAIRLAAPVEIKFASFEGTANGYYNPIDNNIIVKKGLSQMQTIKTTLHEIAHVMMHADMFKNEESRANLTDEDRMRQEIEAESVAFSVSAHYGIDTSAYSFGYIASWSKKCNTDTLRSSLSVIRSASAAMIANIDTVIKPYPGSHNNDVIAML